MGDASKRARIDWAPIRSEYVTTNVSKKALAAKYGVSTGALSYRSGVERWAEQRQQHRDRVLEKTSQRMSDSAAERLAQLMGGTDKLLSAVLSSLDDPDQFYRYLVKGKADGDSVTREETFRKADTKAMKDTAALLEKLTALTRDLYGLPDREQELREARLALEMQKLEQGLGDQTRIEVVFADGDDAWNE